MPGSFVVNGQVGLLSPRQLLAANGSYYVATTPTPGTGVATGVVTGFSATADGLFTISNNNPLGGRSIYLDYLALNMSGTAPTVTTVMKMAAFLESGIVAPSAGNVAVVPKPVNPLSAGTGAVVNMFSAAMMTIPAAVGTRSLVANWSIPTSLGITGDSYVTQFGGDQSVIGGSTAVRATAAARLAVVTAPITIPPNYTAILDWWWLTMATNGATFEVELGYAEL